MLDDRAARARGRERFVASCALCHGERADGRGPRGAAFERHPVDFGNRSWRATAEPERVFRAIRDGIPGTPMPAWRGAFSAAETSDLVAYVMSVAEEGTR